jgi:hypothetical protein
LHAEVKAAIETVGVEAFSFLKQIDDARRAVERRLRRKINKILGEYESDAAAAIEAGREPAYDAFFAEMRAAIQPEVTAMMTNEAVRVSSELGIVFDPAIINTDAVRWARQYTYDMVNGLTNTTRNLIRETTAAFIETPGMTTGDLVRMLQPAFGKDRAEMIGVTEVTRAYSEATNEVQELVNRTGLQMRRVWHTSQDDRVCIICGPLNGQPEEDWRGQFPDGPPAHPRCRCGEGLSLSSAEEHRAEAAVLAAEREQMLILEGRPLDTSPPVAAPTIPTRPIGIDEQGLLDEIAETQAYYEEARRAGRNAEAEGVKTYLDGVRDGLKNEQRINQALWDRYQMTPQGASDDIWRRLADELEHDGYEMYKKYTKEGISLAVDEMRGAKESGYMVVGKEQVMVNRGAFSVRQGVRVKGDMWAEAKEEMTEAAGELLRQAGFSSRDIAQANFEQRRRLLAELGEMEMTRTGRGRVSRIDRVPETARESVLEAVDYDRAATYANSALDPLHLPTLDAYGKMETADLIRSVILGQ